MLGKLITTILVIVAAVIFIRKKNERDLPTGDPKGKQSKKLRDSGQATAKRIKKEKADDTLSSDLRFAAYMFLALMIGLGGTLYYFKWQDDHTILTVNLHRENQAKPVSYEVYKYQLQTRSFTTLNGIIVTVADSERMEVLGLED
jgi:hypothetical protein